MPKFRRLVVPGYPHHVTQRGVRRQTTFFDDDDYQAYLDLASEQLKRAEVEVWAYCLMPNHMHAVVIPKTSTSLSTFFGPLHRKYARQTNKKHDWAGHLWQGRFYSVVMDESHTFAAMRYVELNPIRAGLCDTAVDWPWSSAKVNLGLAESPLVSRRSTRNVISDWHDYLGQRENSVVIERLRTQTMCGRPDGSPIFVKTV